VRPQISDLLSTHAGGASRNSEPFQLQHGRIKIRQQT
jgi:hypothetical protein